MKDYLLSFSILGLVLGFYSALVLSQSKPVHTTAHSSRAVGTLNSELSEFVSGNLTENNSEPVSTVPSIGNVEKLTR